MYTLVKGKHLLVIIILIALILLVVIFNRAFRPVFFTNEYSLNRSASIIVKTRTINSQLTIVNYIKVLKPKSSWDFHLNFHNLILSVVLLILLPTSIFIIKTTRRKVYNVQIRPVLDVNTNPRENTLNARINTKNSILLKNVVGLDVNELHKLIRELCKLGFKVFLTKEDMDKLDNSTKIINSKCVDIIESKLSNNNVYVSDVESIKHILKVIEEIEKSSKIKQSEANKKANTNEQVKVIVNSTVNKVSKVAGPIIPKDLYAKLRHGISEKELNKLPDEYKLLIKILRDEGLIYVERGRIYKLVSKHLDLLY